MAWSHRGCEGSVHSWPSEPTTVITGRGSQWTPPAATVAYASAMSSGVVVSPMPSVNTP